MTSPGQGERRLRKAIDAARPVPSHAAEPKPTDAWGWEVEDRLKRLEDLQRWLLLLMAGTIIGSLLALTLQAIHP